MPLMCRHNKSEGLGLCLAFNLRWTDGAHSLPVIMSQALLELAWSQLGWRRFCGELRPGPVFCS